MRFKSSSYINDISKTFLKERENNPNIILTIFLKERENNANIIAAIFLKEKENYENVANYLLIFTIVFIASMQSPPMDLHCVYSYFFQTSKFIFSKRIVYSLNYFTVK